MKKAPLFLLFLLLTVRAAYSQIDWSQYSHSFPAGVMDKASTVGIITAIPKPNDSYWDMSASTDKLDELAGDSLFPGLDPANIVIRTTFDTARVHFFLHGVTPKNAGDYQFRVMVYPAGTVLIPWSHPRRFTESAQVATFGLMAYLGGFTSPLGQRVSVEVRRTGNRQFVSASVIARVAIRPAITSLYTSDNLDDFFKKLQHPWARENDANRVSGRVDKASEPLTLPVTNRNLIFVLNANIYSKEQVQYELIRDGDVVVPWQNNEYDNNFIWLKDYRPGSYRLNIRYTVQPQHIADYYFRVEPAWYQSTGFKIMVGIFVAACSGAGLFLVLFMRQKQKSRRAIANKTKLQLELRAIYAQLNPHFVFNALSSIQGLINKGDIEGANNYLTDFARLMRESLTNSHKAEVSLDEELRGLDTYLKLEQLRFGFQYQVTLDEAINRYDTSLPALLLQPLVENAVKHGVSALQDAGLVTIRFDKTGETLVVRIADNGQGFPAQKHSAGDFPAGQSTGGYGLKLTRDRINLLNELNSQQPIHLAINPRLPTGTEVVLLFKHWFV